MKRDAWTRPKCRKNIRELKHQTFLEPRRQPEVVLHHDSHCACQDVLGLRSRTSTREFSRWNWVQILCSSKSFRHTKVEIPRLKSYFPRKRDQNLTQIFERHFLLNYSVGVCDGFTLFCLMIFICRANCVPDRVRPAMLFENQERLVLKFPIVLVGQTQDGMVYQLYDVVLYCWTRSSDWRILSTGLEKG